MSELQVQYRGRREIEQEAERLLREHALYDVPVDPIRLAEALKIPIFVAKFGDDSISGVLARRGPSVTMLINASDSAHRKRFTIAHELGHRVLKHFEHEDDHTDRNRDLLRMVRWDEQQGSDRPEVQANMFAAALLMPESLVRLAFETAQDVDKLAGRFQVSSEAMGYRLSTIGLL